MLAVHVSWDSQESRSGTAIDGGTKTITGKTVTSVASYVLSSTRSVLFTTVVTGTSNTDKTINTSVDEPAGMTPAELAEVQAAYADYTTADTGWLAKIIAGVSWT